MKKFMLWFAKFISQIVNLLPRSLRMGLSKILGSIWWDVLRLRHLTVFRNLTIVFPKMSKQDKIKLARESISWMGFSLLEFLKIPALTKRHVQRELILEGVENYEKAAAEGKGILMLSLHMGNGDYGTALLSTAGFSIDLISKRFKMQILNDFWFGIRESRGVRFIDPHGRKTPFEILRSLGQNRTVVFVLDQFMGKPYGIETTFFGRKTGTAYGLALFALKTEAPVVPGFTYRDAAGHTRVVFGPAIPRSSNPNREQAILEMTQNYNAALEKIILAHPEQWMWVHRRWKTWE